MRTEAILSTRLRSRVKLGSRGAVAKKRGSRDDRVLHRTGDSTPKSHEEQGRRSAEKALAKGKERVEAVPFAIDAAGAEHMMPGRKETSQKKEAAWWRGQLTSWKLRKPKSLCIDSPAKEGSTPMGAWRS